MSRLVYLPALQDAATRIAEHQVARLVVLGHLVEDGLIQPGRTRVAVPDVSLPRGLYMFARGDERSAMVVKDGAPQGPASEAGWDADETHPLRAAYGWFEHLWGLGAEAAPPRFSVSDEVERIDTGQEVRIQLRQLQDGEWRYRIRAGGRTQTVRESNLRPVVFDDDPLKWVEREPAAVDRFAATLTRAKLNEHLTDTVYSFRATRTMFRPYQFKPLLRLLEVDGSGLLIADEVGLGKTIEAGLIWTEFDARRQANRVLVICPAPLVTKWQAEMEQRFDYELVELDRDGLDRLLEQAEGDRLPHRLHLVVSLQRLRIWGGLEALADLNPHFDLVIADEAHAFRNRGTKSYALGSVLHDWADLLLFLSATPLNLGNDDLFNLLQLLAPGDFDDSLTLSLQLEPNAVLHRLGRTLQDTTVTGTDRVDILDHLANLAFGPAVMARAEFGELRELVASGDELLPGQVADARRLIARLHALSAVVTRTRKVEVVDRKTIRDAVTVDVDWTEEERGLYEEVLAWRRAVAERTGVPVGFSGQMPLRLASSCLQAAKWTFEQRRADWRDLDASQEEVEDPGAPPLEVLEAARALGAIDSKFDRFAEMLVPILDQDKRVLVFTFSRATLAYLHARLGELCRVGALHGGVHREDRAEIMQRFRSGDYDMLLASRVASEGLDFEFCSAVVNYDLPWNPMEVEQRIGRIDRFGQTEDQIKIINFFTPGTIEGDILERVHDRIGVFTDSIGDLEPILHSHLRDIQRTLFDFGLTDAQREAQLDQAMAALEEQRRARDDVDDARQVLSSLDDTDVEGFEGDVVSRGGYIGQAELVLLLQDWCQAVGNASCVVDESGTWLHFSGNAEMASEIDRVRAAGLRSGRELADIASALRNEHELRICLDQEVARRDMAPLLTANHPLVRAAAAMPNAQQERYAHVALSGSDAPAGQYLVLLGIARWSGLRPSNEIWSTAVDLDTGDVTSEVGDRLLQRVADAGLRPFGGAAVADLSWAIQDAMTALAQRQNIEESRRLQQNAALIETRLTSLRETHQRKVRQIEERLNTAREKDAGVARMFEGQLRRQHGLLREKQAEIEDRVNGALSVEHLAVAVVKVTP